MELANITILIVPLDEVGRLLWVSGFSGSNGQAAITQEEGKKIIQMNKRNNF